MSALKPALSWLLCQKGNIYTPDIDKEGGGGGGPQGYSKGRTYVIENGKNLTGIALINCFMWR